MWIIVRLLIGIAILVIVEFYFIKHVNLAIKLFFPTFYEKKFHLVRKVFLIWMNLYPLVLIFIFTYFAITGSYLPAPESRIIDYLIIYPFWTFFVLIIQCCLFFLPLDLIKIFSHLFIKKTRKHLLKIRSTLLFLIIGFFILYIPIRIIYDYNAVSVRVVDYQKENLPLQLENFKIVFISDLQADHYTDEGRLSNYIDKVNSLNPDLVLIAGDLITNGPNYIELSAREVGKLKAKYGIYSCVGDHDNWAYRNDYARSLTEVKSVLNYHGVQMIDNDIKTINVDSAEIAITLITNTYVETVPQNVLDSLSSNNKGDFKIFLTHQPQEFLIGTAYKNNFDLFLAGHTHGGQITFVFPFIQLTPTMIETKYIRGDFWFGGMLMVINRGLGMSLAPIRYNSTPEITLITLSKKD
ncbi:MAG TPA: metallophosphoesterase [Ignavibacteriaceae bacterium]|nr:metallophosphoesterase [Ignavibacteriaceae bacterium]